MLSRQNANLAKGQISNGTYHAPISCQRSIAQGRFYKPLIVGYHNGAAIKLSDVADVEDSVQNMRAAGFVDGKPPVC